MSRTDNNEDSDKGITAVSTLSNCYVGPLVQGVHLHSSDWLGHTERRGERDGDVSIGRVRGGERGGTEEDKPARQINRSENICAPKTRKKNIHNCNLASRARLIAAACSSFSSSAFRFALRASFFFLKIPAAKKCTFGSAIGCMIARLVDWHNV